MAIIETSRPVPFGAVTTLQIVNLFDTGVAKFKAWNLARKTEAMLNGLSDRQLADIGLERNQIHNTTMDLVLRRFF